MTTEISTGLVLTLAVRRADAGRDRPGHWPRKLGARPGRTHTEKSCRVSLSTDQLATLWIADPTPAFHGDLLRLGLQAYALGIAWEFDPYFGLSIPRGLIGGEGACGCDG